jgi:hypothetical protein
MAKALIDAGMDSLDQLEVDTVGFEVFGQAHRLVPYLKSRHGFEYNPHSQEYVSFRPRSREAPESPAEDPAPVIVLAREGGNLGQPISEDHIAEYTKQVSQVVKAATEHVLQKRVPVDSYHEYTFKRGGHWIDVRVHPGRDEKEWQVIEEEASELVTSTRGVVLATGQRYIVTQEKGGPYIPAYEEELQVRGSYGSTRPLTSHEKRLKDQEPGFTEGRYERVMAILRKLSPEHLLLNPF